MIPYKRAVDLKLQELYLDFATEFSFYTGLFYSTDLCGHFAVM